MLFKIYFKSHLSSLDSSCMKLISLDLHAWKVWNQINIHIKKTIYMMKLCEKWIRWAIKKLENTQADL